MVRSVQGRTLVYAIVYSLGATRCIILHLATSESLQHAMGGEDGSLMLCGLTVALVSLALVQVICCASLLWCSSNHTLSLQQQRTSQEPTACHGQTEQQPCTEELHWFILSAWLWARWRTVLFCLSSFTALIPCL